MHFIFTFLFLCFSLICFGQVPDKYNYPDTLWIYGQSNDSEYGFIPQKPIQVGGGILPKHIYRYLNNLMDSDSLNVVYRRIGSCCNELNPSGKSLISFNITLNGSDQTIYFASHEWNYPQLLQGLAWRENRLGYRGEYGKDSIFQGHGIYFFEDGGYYKGNFENGLMNGQGEMYVPYEEKYVGEFSDGKYHGFGIMYYPDGGRYEGQWNKSKRHGQAKIYYPLDADIEYMQGIYKKDSPVGNFEVKYKDGTIKTHHFK